MSSSLVHIGTGERGFQHRRLPPHCVRTQSRTPVLRDFERRLRRSRLHSVCEEARCPNRSECWSRRHIAFLLLGDVCTRSCRFCAITTGRPPMPPDPEEPDRVARLAVELEMAHGVLTSVNRDDLADGGAAQFAATVRAIRARRPQASVEVLTPDFRGNLAAVATVCEAAPQVYNHNVETIPRLYRRVRPGAVFERSLAVLAEAKRLRPASVVKSGLMVGFGEGFDEVVEVLGELRSAGVDALTIGQYLRPTRHHLPVERYWDPPEFDALADSARDLGFPHVASGPLVRSSYAAEETYESTRLHRPQMGPVGEAG